MTGIDRPFVCSRCGERRERYAFHRHTGHPVCATCNSKDLTIPESVTKTSALADVVMLMKPEISRRAVISVIQQVAPNRNALSVLARQVAVDPAVLTSGSSTSTKSLSQLIDALIAAGAKGIQPLRCGSCNRVTKLANRVGGQRVCNPCYLHSREGECADCGETRPVKVRKTTGLPQCRSCQHKDRSSWESCSGCGDVRPVNARTDAGEALCVRCYDQPLDSCDRCGCEARISSRKSGEALCARCYRHPQRMCGRCGRVRRIYRRSRGGDPDLCHACWFEPIAICSRCGLEGMCNGIRKGAPLCLRCRLDDRLQEQVLGPEGEVPEWFVPLKEAIVGVGNPRSGHVWMSRSPAVAVLRDLASGKLPLTHEALDGLSQKASIIHLRDLLTAAGALAERDPYVARLECTIKESAASLQHEEDARILKAYGTWRVLHRVRKRVERGRESHSVVNYGQQLVREAARFLTWLRCRGRSLTSLTQADVDEWFATDVKARDRARAFLVWAIEQRATCDLALPPTRKHSPLGPVDLNARWSSARRLLHDGDLDPADRVVGALVVIYAQRLTNIARLTVGDVSDSNGEVFVRLGKEAVWMPEPLGGFLRQLPWRRQVGIAGKLKQSAWLFPGRQAGRHQHPSYLRTRLARIGIECNPARNAALIQLAGQVPAAVLADMLGLHPNTATRWVELAGGNWAGYAAMRSGGAP
ncbi:MAG: hypothetical protein ACRDJ2_07190 [Actinomycetota bacterium]